MGLAASQARFLCLTARKANCEYKSTELAQQKLEITNQLADISNDYSQALNSTKLMWSNEGIDGDYGVTYSLLMSPSPMNDFNPYMVTTPSGAVVLNDKYAAAARAAGMSKAGGIGSQQSRDKFISALVTQGLITEATAKKITEYDYEAVVDDATNKISFVNENVAPDSSCVLWNPAAGMGAEPLNKGAAQAMDLVTMAMSTAIGQQTIDWAKIFTKEDEITELEYKNELKRLTALKTSLNSGSISNDVVIQLKRDLANYEKNKPAEGASEEDKTKYNEEVERLNNLINCAINGGIDPVSGNDNYSEIRDQINKDYNDFVDKYNSPTSTSKFVKVEDGFNVDENDLDYGENGHKSYNIVMNGVVNHYKDEIKNMTIGDLLLQQVVLVANDTIDSGDSSADLRAFAEASLKLLNSISAIFGYSPTESLRDKGLNVDDASENALKFAYDMVKNTYLKTNLFEKTGSRLSDHAMLENSAYINATTYNRLGGDSDNKYYAISLSQMVAAFLTYFDNALVGADSSYVVGKSKDTSTYVTDNSAYQYFVQAEENAVDSIVEKESDFFDQLYNNILEHGWREDDAVDDNEYLEASLKNGRYSMSSLNQDGYYYQTRYNETGYMVEVMDTDAIARAEAEFTAKKAELTYKEDSIDIKTKKLDAEIAAITTEVDSVKNIIAKGIEKTFSMFSS